MIDKDRLRREAEEFQRSAESIKNLDKAVETRSNMGERQNLVKAITDVQYEYLNTPQFKVAWKVGTFQDELIKSVNGLLLADHSSIASIKTHYNGTPNWDTVSERRLLATECFQRIESLKRGILEGKLDHLLHSHANVLVHGVMGYYGELLPLLGIDPKQGETYKRITEVPKEVQTGQDEISQTYAEARLIEADTWKNAKDSVKKIIEDMINRPRPAKKARVININKQSNLAKKPDTSDIENGIPTGGFMGVIVQDLNEAIASQMGLGKETRGALIIEVFKGSIAESVGLRVGNTPGLVKGEQVMLGGDVIIGVDDTPITNAEDFREYVRLYHAPRTKIRLKLIRNREPVELALNY